MTRTAWVACALLALGAAGVDRASAQSWPGCRAEIQQLLADNALVFWAAEEESELRYTMRIDEDRWDALGSAGQDALESLLSCSISAGEAALPYALSVRSAYSNRELARYHDGERQPLD